MPNVPTSVRVLAIIGIILGCLGILGTMFSAVMLFVTIGPPNPMLEPLRHDSLYLGITAAGLAIGMPLAVLLIVASIQSLRLVAWARRGMLIYAWAAIAQVLFGSAFNIFYVFPKMFGGLPPDADPAVKAGAMGGVIGGVCGSILGIVYPIFVLVYFNRKSAKDAFAGHTAPAAYPGDPAAVDT